MNNTNINVRINNIEFRTITDTTGDFRCWSPNPDYGKLEAYLQNGWVDEGDGTIVQTEPHKYTMSKSLFELKETCCVVAWLKYDEKEEVCDLETVGDRMLRLENIHDFMDVYKIADKKMKEMNKRDE